MNYKKAQDSWLRVCHSFCHSRRLQPTSETCARPCTVRVWSGRTLEGLGAAESVLPIVTDERRELYSERARARRRGDHRRAWHARRLRALGARCACDESRFDARRKLGLPKLTTFDASRTRTPTATVRWTTGYFSRQFIEKRHPHALFRRLWAYLTLPLCAIAH
jgi:hypothetical protein